MRYQAKLIVKTGVSPITVFVEANGIYDATRTLESQYEIKSWFQHPIPK